MQRGEKEAFSCKCKKKLMQLARDFSRFLLASCAAGPRLGRAQVSKSNLTQHGKQFLRVSCSASPWPAKTTYRSPISNFWRPGPAKTIYRSTVGSFGPFLLGRPWARLKTIYSSPVSSFQLF